MKFYSRGSILASDRSLVAFGAADCNSIGIPCQVAYFKHKKTICPGLLHSTGKSRQFTEIRLARSIIFRINMIKSR